VFISVISTDSVLKARDGKQHVGHKACGQMIAAVLVKCVISLLSCTTEGVLGFGDKLELDAPPLSRSWQAVMPMGTRVCPGQGPLPGLRFGSQPPLAMEALHIYWCTAGPKTHWHCNRCVLVCVYDDLHPVYETHTYPCQ